MQKIGVFVCHCGTNIAATVDVEAVAEALGREPSVAVSTDYPYMCSAAGQKLIQDDVRDEKLDGITDIVDFYRDIAEELRLMGY